MIHAGNNGNIGSHTFQVLKTNRNHVRGRFMISGKIQWGQITKANSVGPLTSNPLTVLEYCPSVGSARVRSPA